MVAPTSLVSKINNPVITNFLNQILQNNGYKAEVFTVASVYLGGNHPLIFLTGTGVNDIAETKLMAEKLAPAIDQQFGKSTQTVFRSDSSLRIQVTRQPLIAK